MHTVHCDFEILPGHQIPARRPDLVFSFLKNCMGTKKSWIMRMTVIPIVVGMLGTVPKNLVRRLKELKIGERIENIQTTALRSARILRQVPETCGGKGGKGSH